MCYKNRLKKFRHIEIEIITSAVLTALVALGIKKINDRKRNITLQFVQAKRVENGAYLLVQFQAANHSKIPISITRMQLVLDDQLCDVDFIPVCVEDSRLKILDSTYSELIPINLGAHTLRNWFFAFKIHSNTYINCSENLTFIISTNRGKSVKKNFSLNDNIHIT